jgi:hypothetical protein
MMKMTRLARLFAAIFFGAVAAAAASPSKDDIRVAASVSYLRSAYKEAEAVASAMAGLQDGSTTLGEVRDQTSKLSESPSEKLSKAAAQIDETHRLFHASMAEYLEYWNDSNPAHLASGNATFKKFSKVIAAATQSLKKAQGLAK